ncbi:DUF4331 domain-containing protein [Nocardioides sp.]|uniref:DUF4331 domain-containing protein n=1 Tax=Nocardioides sp. TaxID=35761 RepID=UPI002723DAD7|nr:DUF4331 domain-containing protein [Nocardioides sp.]MDO9456471.1 DUF4331 domain-containing protein [Nocardioides sp.]
MSSHREAPEIAKDPAADSTDVYAFMHPTEANQVVIICNFIPLQQPNGGPNFYEFADDVLYEINVSNGNKAEANVKYQFRFKTAIRNPNTFLYNTGPITSITSTSYNRPQTYSVVRVKNGQSTAITGNLPVPPCNVGVRSTPNYAALANQATRTVSGRKFFAGQRTDAFQVDLGSIFDLGALRPFGNLHAYPQAATDGVNAVQSYNVHTIAIQVPSSDLTANGANQDGAALNRRNVIGVWSSTSRRSARVFNAKTGKYAGSGPAVQVSRLGNPLFNEVVVPMAEKDYWNTQPPNGDVAYEKYVNKPELGALLPALYPNVFPNLGAYTKPRADLNAILLTGIPYGVLKDAEGQPIRFQNYTGPVKADMLRLNMAIPPSATENKLGILGNDLAGYPNGRRLGDDVVAIELKAIAGATIPLVDPSFTPDGAAALLEDGTTDDNRPELLDAFPFMPLPGSGYNTVPGTSAP